MTETRSSAGLTWRPDGPEAWVAEDDHGTFKLVEWGEGLWMDFWWPKEDGCGCGAPPAGGRDWPDFDTAAREIVALAEERGPGCEV